MALWGKTDEQASIPKYLTDAQKQDAVFVSAEEAALKTNKDKGILGAGWWLVKEYTGSNGETRYKTEHLVAMSVLNSVSGDAADDAKVADVEVTITISQQPSNDYFWNGHPATFNVVASASSGTLTYQWQKKGPAAGSRWANIAGATSDTYDTADTLADADNNTQFRVVVGTDNGAAKVTSDAALAILD